MCSGINLLLCCKMSSGFSLNTTYKGIFVAEIFAENWLNNLLLPPATAMLLQPFCNFLRSYLSTLSTKTPSAFFCFGFITFFEAVFYSSQKLKTQ